MMWIAKSEMNQLRVQKGDLLVSEGGEVGRACVWNDELPECYIQNSVHRVTVEPAMLSEFLFQQFFVHGKRGRFNSIVNRVSIAHLTREKLVTVAFAVPPVSEQEAICKWITGECKPLEEAIQRAEGGEVHFRSPPELTYTTKQAIQEGFILDVIKNYTPVDSFYRRARATRWWRPRRHARHRQALEHHQDVQRPVRQHRLEGRRQDSQGHRRGHSSAGGTGQSLPERPATLRQAERKARARQGAEPRGAGAAGRPYRAV